MEQITMSAAVSVTGVATFDRSWRSQFRRMHRAFDRLHGVAPLTNSFIAADVEDGFMSFFQAAWHLKDWLWNDPQSAPLVRADIEVYANQYPKLKLAADLANGAKHLGLNRKTRTGDASTDMRTMRFGGDPTVGLTATIEVTSQGVTYDAVQLARDVISLWEAYLARKNLVA